VACSIWMAARGQSEQATTAAASSMPLNACRPHRMEASKFSRFMAQVPSCPEQACTMVTSVSGSSDSRALVLLPSRWARRWHGMW